MLWAVAYQQNLNPLGHRLLSTVVAALPVLVLFYLLVPRRWLASKAGAAGAVTAILIAWLIYQMPLEMALWSFGHGVAFGLLPIGWTVFNAMLLYNLTLETGQFRNIRRSVAGVSGDARIQAILIGFAFGAFLEGAAGAGTPIAVCGAMLVGLGFHPILAAVVCLIANTSPVAYGGLGTPIITLASVTDLSGDKISVMAGHQLPFLSFIVPFYMVKILCTWRQLWEVWPALVVGGGSFALFQYVFATMHTWIPGAVVWYMTDIGGGLFALLVLAIFLRFWRPKNEWHYDTPPTATSPAEKTDAAAMMKPLDELDEQQQEAVEEAKTMLEDVSPITDTRPLTRWEIFKAWSPFLLMSLFMVGTSFIREQESKGVVPLGPIQTLYAIEIPTLHKQVERAKELQKPHLLEPEREDAIFKFAWLTAPGSPVFLAAVVSMVLFRMSRAQIVRVVAKTCIQMRVPIPTIACMLGLSYVTRYAGMDATLGVAFAETGFLYPFFAAMLGWLGVFLTGTDAGSNALFGSLQKITADRLHQMGVLSALEPEQARILICTANSTGGVMGKMIDAQSICVATAGTNQIGKEADIFKAVVWHSVFLASIVGLMTLLQAYVWPFTAMVPD